MGYGIANYRKLLYLATMLIGNVSGLGYTNLFFLLKVISTNQKMLAEKMPIISNLDMAAGFHFEKFPTLS